jgi:hypothetical protein
VPAAHNPFALAHARERAERTLANAFGAGLLDDEELDVRMEALVHAEDLAGVERLVVNLPPAPELEDDSDTETALAPRGVSEFAARAQLSLEQIEEEREIVTVFGELSQKGAWTPARRNRMLTVFGSGTIDLREAQLGPGTTEIELRCVFAEVAIIVPPELAVEVACTAILAEVEHDDRFREFNSEAPSIRVTGFAVLSSVEIKERERGEGWWGARKRRKRERKRLGKGRSAKALKSGRRERRDT